MNPFDGPPSSPPISFDRPPGPPTEPVEPPAPTPEPEPRRGRMVAAVFATAGLLGAVAFGVSELASADDDPELTAVDETDDTDDKDGDETDAERGDGDEAPSEGSDDPPSFSANGELRLDLGDGEPIIIDLDDIDPESLGEFTECIGLPGLDFGDGLPGLDPEQFEQQFDEFFGEFDLDQFDEFFGDFDFDFDETDPEQFEQQFDEFFEDFDPEQFEEELGPLFESEQFGDLFDQFLGEFDPELFDQFFEDFDPEQFDQFFEGLPPLGGEFGEHEAGRRSLDRFGGPDLFGGAWFPAGLDQDQIEACLAELD